MKYYQFRSILFYYNVEIDKDKDIDEVDSKVVTFKAENRMNFINDTFAYYNINPKTQLTY